MSDSPQQTAIMREHSFPFTSVYLLLLLVAVIASWLVGLYGVEGVNSLLSVEGVRWWARSALTVFSTSPVGEILLILFTLGIVRKGCTRWSRKAFGVAALIFSLLLALFLWGISSGCLLSVTGHSAHSPLQRGWLLVLALMVGVPCLGYGLTCGALSNGPQALKAISSEVARCAPAFVALFAASQLMAVLSYSRLPDVCGMSGRAFHWMAIVLYGLPFVFEYLKKPKI